MEPTVIPLVALVVGGACYVVGYLKGMVKGIKAQPTPRIEPAEVPKIEEEEAAEDEEEIEEEEDEPEEEDDQEEEEVEDEPEEEDEEATPVYDWPGGTSWRCMKCTRIWPFTRLEVCDCDLEPRGHFHVECHGFIGFYDKAETMRRRGGCRHEAVFRAADVPKTVKDANVKNAADVPPSSASGDPPKDAN